MKEKKGQSFPGRSIVGGLLIAGASALTGCTPSPSMGVNAPLEVSSYAEAWQYRWGDSPRLSEGAFAWTVANDSPEWRILPNMGSPAGRDGSTSLWLRTRLAGQTTSEPTLYLRGVDQIFEAYVDSTLVYRFGSFDGPDARRFLGYKAHYIPLGNAYQGKTLTLRIHSDHVNIGIFGEPLIGARADLLTLVTRRDLPTLAMGSVMVSIGAFVFLLFLARRKERGYLTYSLLALTLGAYFTSASPSRQLILDAPLAWVHAELFFLYIAGGLLTAYVEFIFGRGWRGIIRWLAIAFFAYTMLAAILVATGLVPVLKTLLPNQLLLLVAMFVLTVQTVRGAWSGGPDVRIFGVGFIAAASAGTYDVLGAMGVLSRTNVPIGHLGIFAFTLALGLILARRFLEVQERLGQYSTVLGLSLASARVLEPGTQAQIALDELLRLLKGKRAFLFLAKPEGSDRPGELELRAMRDVAVQGVVEREASRSFEGLSLRMDVLERVRATQKPLITSTQSGKKRRSAIAAPLLIRDELVGVVYLEADDSRRAFDDADLAVLLGLGTQLSITIVATRAVRLEVQSALQKGRIERQGALLEAASRMAKGDVETPIVVDPDSDLADLGRALDEMRCDVRAKIQMLEARNTDVQVLNDELRRKIEERTMSLLMALMADDAKAPPALRKQGSMIGDRYRIERKLGEGAMGVVYDVERVTDGRHLAIKLLSEVKDKPSVARFIREANILARLDHPNLVSIFDVDVTPDGQLFIVMELFAGQTLEKHKRQNVLWSLVALAQIVEGLAAIHASGIVHRDLKPSNVLVSLTPNGQPVVKLADFGVSTLAGHEETLDAQAGLRQTSSDDNDDEKTVVLGKGPITGNSSFDVTKSGALVGTPSYMAPELGRRGKVVRSSSDLFSFGIMAYELLTKERPFHMPPVFLVASGNKLECPPGLRAVPGLSSELVALFERCLSPDPEARPTAGEIAEELREEKEKTIRKVSR